MLNMMLGGGGGLGSLLPGIPGGGGGGWVVYYQVFLKDFYEKVDKKNISRPQTRMQYYQVRKEL